MKKTLLIVILFFSCSEPVKVFEIEPVGLEVVWVKVNSEPFHGNQDGWWYSIYYVPGYMPIVIPDSLSNNAFYEVVFYGDTIPVYDIYPLDYITHFIEFEYFEFKGEGIFSQVNEDDYDVFEYKYK